MMSNKSRLESEVGSESQQNEQLARSEAECQSRGYIYDDSLYTQKIGIGGGEVPSPPNVLVYNTNNTSQSCFERKELLTQDDIIACETENFLEYIDLLAEKAVLMRSRENYDKGIIIRPCESSRYFEGGRKKTKRNLKKRFGKNFAAPGVFLTLTYDHKQYSRWEAWGRLPADLKRLIHNITMRYNRAGRMSPRYIWVIEEQKQTGYPHVHIFYPRLKWLLTKEDVLLLWKMGRTRVEYADNVHLGGYVCKYITKMGGWSDEALAFIWKNKIRMYGYSRCYHIAKDIKQKIEWDYSYNTINRTVMNKAIKAMRNYKEVIDKGKYLEERDSSSS
jgi:hypothetical protein